MYELTEIVRTCNSIGRNRNLVQGPGGNISLKLDDRRMLVKASGLRLDEITENRGIVDVDYRKITCFVDFDTSLTANVLEGMLYRLIYDSELCQSELRPSMETSFHALLGRAVIHTHPIMTNLATCMVGGYDILKQIFGDFPFQWIEYKNPGFFLGKAINRELTSDDKNGVFFLEKHGLIVASDSLDDCLQKTLDINRRIADYFGLEEYNPQSNLIEVDGGYVNDCDLVKEFLSRYKSFDKYLFPDAVVYCKNPINRHGSGVFYDFDKKRSRLVDEIMLAHMYLLLTIPELGGRINHLSNEDISYILGMEAERYRQSI